MMLVCCEGCKHWKYCHGHGFTKFGMCYEPEEDGGGDGKDV